MAAPSRLVSDAVRVHRFLRECDVRVALSTDAQGIGLERGGELIAGALYHGYSGTNIWVHLAGRPGGHWLTREFLHAGFSYPFVDLGCRRMSAFVDASNRRSRRFCERVGFRVEAALDGAAADGGDVLIYMMRREDCTHA